MASNTPTTTSDASPSSSSSSRQENELEGYVQNIHQVKGGFSFDLQNAQQCSRVLCFSPSKRPAVESKSPVKVSKTRKMAKGKDYILDESSSMEDIDVEYEPKDYSNITIDKLKNVANGSLVNIVVKVMALKSQSTSTTGKHIAIYVISDPTGSVKLSIWENCAGPVNVGKTYLLKNARVKKDDFGTISLTTPMQGFTMETSDRFMEPVQMLDPMDDELVGEIMSIDAVSFYKLCIGCKKTALNCQTIHHLCRRELWLSQQSKVL